MKKIAFALLPFFWVNAQASDQGIIEEMSTPCVSAVPQTEFVTLEDRPTDSHQQTQESKISREIERVADQLDREIPRIQGQIERETTRIADQLDQEAPKAIETVAREGDRVVRQVSQVFRRFGF